MLKKLTKGLSLLLVFCLMVSLLSVGALAVGEDEAPAETPVVEEEDSVLDEVPEEETDLIDDTSEDVPDDIPSEPVSDENPNAVMAMFNTDEGVAAASYSTKPADSSTTSQPFSSGTGGSTNFRIPALITMSNGNLLAAADARYSGTGDGYGLDTIVSYSTNNGSTWNYSFVNYFDDSTGYNGSASAFIDPVLVQGKDGTVYLFADLYPGGGYYIANIKSGTGFTTVDGVSYLALYSSTSATSSTTPAYYVANEPNSDGYYTVYNYSSKTASNYALDAEYDIYTVSNGTYTAVTGTQIDSSSTTINANVFYTGTANQSGLYVLGTEYITMRKGTVNGDGSITWGGLQLLNVKNSSESFYGFGPGGGIVTSTGRIIVPLYTYANGADGKTSVIYSDDNGETWTRSADMNVQTSEASISEVTVGETNYLYMFTRHGGYFVSSDNGATWSTQKSVSGISYTTSCELSTLTYSKLIDGYPAILLSAPTANRTTGKIFVGLVQSDGSITWQYTYGVNGSGTFQYSDLAELPDGSIGLLYESGSAAITYTNLAISTIASGATIGEGTGTTDPSEPSVPTATKEVSIYVGQTYTDTIESADYSSNIDKSELDESIATVSAEYEQVTGGTEEVKATSITSGSSYYIKNSSGQYLSSSAKWVSDISSAALWTATSSGSGYTLKNGNNYLVYWLGSLSTTAISWSATTWTFSNGTFSYTNWGSTYTLGDAYTVTTTDPVDATTVTITGKAPGETSVVVGNTTYNITVKEIPPYVDAETTPFTVGSSHTGADEILTKLTLSVGLTYDIDLASNYSGGTWSIADTSIATVDQDGKVTGVATGETTLTYTADNGVAYTIPVVIVQNTTSTSTKICSLHITEITATSVWYSWNCSGSEDQFVQAVNGEAIYVSYTSNVAYCINFYGAPEEGYALTFMSATNSSGQYLALQNKSDPTQCDFYTKSGAGMNERGYSTFGDTKVASDIKAALNLGCDGAQGFSRNTGNTSSVDCDLTFRSQKLPTVEKTIVTVGGQSYTEGMTAKAGNVIVYNVTVTQYATTEAIEYTDEILTDNLSGAKFTNNSNSITPSLSDSALDNNQTTTYQVAYTIQDSDLDKDIINTVDLTYSYSSTYSSGTFGGSANAKATISAPTFTPYDIVVDFSMPVTIDYSGENAHGRYNLSAGTASYGDVTVSNNKVTYTPNTILQGVDTVTLTNTAGGTYTFNVYPATTVYYEEGFATYNEGDGWSGTENNPSKGTGTQATQIAGSSSNEYGFDAKYAGELAGPSNKTQATSGAQGDKAEFTFTGTGVDIYANTSTNTGTLIIQVKNTDGANVKLLWVDTAMRNGSSDATDFQAVTGYNVPVASITGLTHGTYTVIITNLGTKSADDKDLPVSLDGFRIYGTLEIEPAFYVTDKEDNPTFIELRDQVLYGLSVNSDGSGQVYAGGKIPEGTNVAVVASSDKYTKENVNDLLTNGPKNEIYLQKDQALVLKITTAREVQIGLKALNAATTYTITGKNGDQAISTSTDMFYTVLNKNSSGVQTITITNTGSGILSVTKLKVCDDPNAALVPLTEDDLADALATLGIMELEPTEPEVTYADASLTVKVNDASTVLTKNGVAGETATFTAAEIQSAAAALVPDGSVLDDVSFTDVEVVYGASGEVTFTASAEVVDPKPEPEPEPEPEPDPKPSQPSTIIGRILNGLKNLLSRLFRK